MQNDIKHVVILMLENRSFDNVLGWLYDQNDPSLNFIPLETDQEFLGLSENSLEKYTNTLKNHKNELVYTCKPIKGVPSVANSPYLNSPKFNPHEYFPHVINQIYGFDGSLEPSMTGFLQDYATQWNEDDWIYQKEVICSIMETYTEKELPVLHALAKQYAICDCWFSSVPTQTNPNRAFAICGTSDGQIINGNLGLSLFSSDTIFNRLEEVSKDTSWAIFWEMDAMPFLSPGPYHSPNTFLSMNKIPNLYKHYYKLDAFHQLARAGQLPNLSVIEPQWTISVNLSPTDEECLVGFFRDQELILGLQGNDLHPPGDIRTGENLLANLYTSLTANKEAWEHTLFIITFDEHGGLFDHIPPPSAISPDDSHQNGFAFDRYGVRIPTLFISPKIQKKTVIRSSDCTVPFDHTSVLATLLKWKNIDKKDWKLGKRVDAAPTFEDVFTLKEPRTDSILISDNTQQPTVEAESTVKMGDQFYLRDRNGMYMMQNRSHDLKNRAVFEFSGGLGEITHGSFILIKDALSEDLLTTVFHHSHCFYEINNHTSRQWWTIKNKAFPYLGYPIQYGDQIYLENHTYTELINYVPCRLTRSLFYPYLTTSPITEEDSENHYWYIEKANNFIHSKLASYFPCLLGNLEISNQSFSGLSFHKHDSKTLSFLNP